MLEDIFSALRRLSFLRDTFIPSVCFLSAAETLEVRVFSPLLLRPSMKHNPPPTISEAITCESLRQDQYQMEGCTQNGFYIGFKNMNSSQLFLIEDYKIVDYYCACMQDLKAKVDGFHDLLMCSSWSNAHLIRLYTALNIVTKMEKYGSDQFPCGRQWFHNMLNVPDVRMFPVLIMLKVKKYFP